MKQITLEGILDKLVREGEEAVSADLHRWFVQESKKILENLMDGDYVEDLDEMDDATASLQDDMDTIEKEEFYGDGELKEDGEEDVTDDEEMVDGDGDDELVDGDGDDEFVADEGDEDADLAARLADLEAEFASMQDELAGLVGAEEVEHDQDFDGDGEIGDGVEGDLDGDLDDGDEMVGDVDSEGDTDLDLETGDEEVEEDLEFIDLEESFELEPVKDPKLDGNEGIGTGGKVGVNTTSPLPNKKVGERVGGKAVEVKSTQHKGFDMEAAPKTVKRPNLKNEVNNANDGRSSVKKEGDSTAVINKSLGAENNVSPLSPIGRKAK